MKKSLATRQRIALERINVLFQQASLRHAYAKRYVVLARRMSSRHKVRIPEKWHRRFCKACSAFLVPGRNCTVRKHERWIAIKCLECNSVRRIGLER